MRLWGLLILVGCYHPTPKAGAPCERDDECPLHQHCIANACANGGGDGGAQDDAAVDAPDAMPVGCVTALAISHEHGCAVRATGGVMCWGHGSQGELGNNMTVDTGTPGTAIGVSSPTAIATGGRHVVALAGGTLYTWGANGEGQLGDGTTTERNVPTIIPPLSSAWAAIGAGARHTCALLADGTVYCWGCAAYNTDSASPRCLTPQTTPTQVMFGKAVVEIAIGSRHDCARLADNTVWCWGRNDYGELGNNTTVASTVPVQAAITGATGLASGRHHTCAIVAGGAVKCWGSNTDAQLGDGTMVDSKVPVQAGTLTGVTQLSAGGWETCAVSSGTVYCWGADDKGQSGAPGLANVLVPTAVNGLVTPVEVHTGTQVTCARDDRGVECWGANTRGQLGRGTAADMLAHAAPEPVILGCP